MDHREKTNLTDRPETTILT